METVGIRELKRHRSRHLKRVRSGARRLVIDRGRSIATISPLEAPADLTWASQLVAGACPLEWRPANGREESRQSIGQPVGFVRGARASPVTLILTPAARSSSTSSEAGSDKVRALVEVAAVGATSIVTYAETRAALARLRRERALTVARFRSARREFEEQWPSFMKLDATDALCRTAGELAEQYQLRGFDSVHLASFAEVARRAGPRETRFSSFDDRLNQAARKLAWRLRRHS